MLNETRFDSQFRDYLDLGHVLKRKIFCKATWIERCPSRRPTNIAKNTEEPSKSFECEHSNAYTRDIAHVNGNDCCSSPAAIFPRKYAHIF